MLIHPRGRCSALEAPPAWAISGPARHQSFGQQHAARRGTRSFGSLGSGSETQALPPAALPAPAKQSIAAQCEVTHRQRPAGAVQRAAEATLRQRELSGRSSLRRWPGGAVAADEEEGGQPHPHADREWRGAAPPLLLRAGRRQGQGPGRQPALHPQQVAGARAAVGALVLQEGAGAQQPQEEAHEADQEAGAARAARPGQGRPVRALHLGDAGARLCRFAGAAALA